LRAFRLDGTIFSSEVRALLLELVRPVGLLACMVSLLAVMHAAFFGSETDFRQRIFDALAMLVIAAGVSLLSGMTFAGLAEENHGPLRLIETFPMRLFCWGMVLMVVLFVLVWYLNTHLILYRDVRY